MECERYHDFIEICSFMDLFGRYVTRKSSRFQYISAYQLKNQLENDRPQTIVTLRNLFIELLKVIYHNVAGKMDNEFEKILIRFLRKIGEDTAADNVSNCGFQVLMLRQKLAILRALLEDSLSKNAKIEEFCRKADGAQLRPKPLGRDCAGSTYWRFNDRIGKSFTVIKDMADDEQEPLCQYIKTKTHIQQVIDHVLDVKPKQYCKKNGCQVRSKIGTFECGTCCKRWHEKCVDMQCFDESIFTCLNCEHEKLMDLLREILD